MYAELEPCSSVLKVVENSTARSPHRIQTPAGVVRGEVLAKVVESYRGTIKIFNPLVLHTAKPVTARWNKVCPVHENPMSTPTSQLKGLRLRL
ncbi:hypothetical protein AAMO2058_000438300 [Amorphochlora amoebiformis]